MIDGPQTGLHKYQLPTVIEASSGITLEVRGLTNQTCMSAGHISAGDQNCNHVSFKDNARQYGWLTARLPLGCRSMHSELCSGESSSVSQG